MTHELETFYKTWDDEAARTAKLLRTLPAGQMDYGKDQGVTPLGELAWHLAQIDLIMSHAIEIGKLSPSALPKGLETPATLEEIATGYDRVHREAVERLKSVPDLNLDTTIPFPDGRQVPIRHVLWNAILHHSLHHRGQLTILIRLAGGKPIGLYGPNKEDFEAMMAARAKG